MTGVQTCALPIFTPVWMVELDDFARHVSETRFPGVQHFKDVRECGAGNLAPVDVVCGGFPCQDVSNAGKRAGIKEGTRSGLWKQFFRIVTELRPRYVLIENVAALTRRGLDVVLRDLASIGFDAEWDVFPASAFGAPHIRKRCFVVAYPNHKPDAPVRGERAHAPGESSGGEIGRAHV